MTWWTWPSLRGAVLEQIPGQLVDIGGGGCSLETSLGVTAGTFGFIEINGPDVSIAEVARVSSVTERPGAALPFLVRLEFLPIALPLQAAAIASGTDAYGAPLVTAGEKAGHSPTLAAVESSTRPGAEVVIAQDTRERRGSAASSDPGPALAEALK